VAIIKLKMDELEKEVVQFFCEMSEEDETNACFAFKPLEKGCEAVGRIIW
jgi:hypothetical protein